MQAKKICVFCSSSDATDNIYKKQTIKLGKIIAQRGDTLLYGGANAGLMSILFHSVKSNNGKTIGVIPQKIVDFGIAENKVDEQIVTENMHSRKALLEELADAFIALPGGFGTLEEISEVLTLKQLAYFNKPIVLFNINGFYNKLIDLFEHFYETKFAKESYRNLYYITTDILNAFEYIDTYQDELLVNKWFTNE
jgi:uncharacterized protein (TIGR00730 family)